jgi:apolipoprotein N-acyltransferase
VLRAIENRKSVIRAANGGISTIIDPLGRTTAETEMFTRTVLTGEVYLNKGETFFTRNSLLIPVPAAAFSLFITGLYFLKKLKFLMKI